MTVKIPDIRDFSRQAKLEMEREVLGVYVSGHPLDDYRERISGISTTDTEKMQHPDENGIRDGERVALGAMIRSVRSVITKKTKSWHLLRLRIFTEKQK